MFIDFSLTKYPSINQWKSCNSIQLFHGFCRSPIVCIIQRLTGKTTTLWAEQPYRQNDGCSHAYLFGWWNRWLACYFLCYGIILMAHSSSSSKSPFTKMPWAVVNWVIGDSIFSIMLFVLLVRSFEIFLHIKHTQQWRLLENVYP